MEKIIISVRDMKCPHCRQRIEDGLKKCGITATVELETKTVTLNESDKLKALACIRELGFEAE